MKTERKPTWLPYLEWSVLLILISWVGYVTQLDGWLSTDALTSFATMTTLVFLYLTWKQVREAKEDSERPHISVSLRMTSDTARILVITNSGASTAINVRLKLIGVKDGLQVESTKTDSGITFKLEDNPLFQSGVDIVPGWLFEFLLQYGEDYAKDRNELLYP